MRGLWVCVGVEGKERKMGGRGWAAEERAEQRVCEGWREYERLRRCEVQRRWEKVSGEGGDWVRILPTQKLSQTAAERRGMQMNRDQISVNDRVGTQENLTPESCSPTTLLQINQTMSPTPPRALGACHARAPCGGRLLRVTD